MKTKLIRNGLWALALPALVSLMACSSSSTHDELDAALPEDSLGSDPLATTDQLPEDAQLSTEGQSDSSLSTSNTDTSSATPSSDESLTTTTAPVPDSTSQLFSGTTSSEPGFQEDVPAKPKKKKKHRARKPSNQTLAEVTPPSAPAEMSPAQGAMEAQTPSDMGAVAQAPVQPIQPIQPVQPDPQAFQPATPPVNMAANEFKPNTNDPSGMSAEITNEPIWKNKWVIGSALLAIIVAAYLFQARSRERF